MHLNWAVTADLSSDDIGRLHSNSLLAIVACQHHAEVGPNGDSTTMTDDRQERIRKRAHQIWEEEGQPAGQHERHWREAAEHVDRDNSKTPSKAKKAPAAGKAKAASKQEKSAAKASKPTASKPKDSKPKDSKQKTAKAKKSAK